MQKSTRYLWYDHQAEEAADLSTSLFEDSRIVGPQWNGDTGPGEPGSMVIAEFEPAGRFVGLNGGHAPGTTFTGAISPSADCGSQEELDTLGAKLTEGGFTEGGGEEGPCGRLKDRFGVPWQIVPSRLPELLGGPDPAGSQRAMAGMKRIEIQGLVDAYQG